MLNKGVNVHIKCIYAPNKDYIPDNLKHENTKFFNSVMDDTNEDDYAHKITVGDFNVALNPDADTCGYLHINNPNLRMNEFM